MQTRRAIERMRDEFANVKDTLVLVRNEQGKKREELNRVGINAFSQRTDADSRAEAERRAHEIQAEIENLKLKEDELQARYNYLQSRLIESEYEELTALLD